MFGVHYYVLIEDDAKDELLKSVMKIVYLITELPGKTNAFLWKPCIQ